MANKKVTDFTELSSHSGDDVLYIVQTSDSTDKKIKVSNIVASKVDITAFNSTGTAPQYVCRSWVNFNGTGVVAIRGSGNVSSLVDNGIGHYTINFTAAMPDTKYVWGGGGGQGATNKNAYSVAPHTSLTGSFEFYTTSVPGSSYDANYACVMIFR